MKIEKFRAGLAHLSAAREEFIAAVWNPSTGKSHSGVDLDRDVRAVSVMINGIDQLDVEGQKLIKTVKVNRRRTTRRR